MKITGAQIVIETLIEQGVTDVFGYPGGQVINLYDALYENAGRINHILTAHEQGAAHAADGYARASGKVGVCIATSGPGATNLVTGIATAMLDSIPMVAITGNVPCGLIGRDGFQEIDITGVTLPITKHNYFVNDINELADSIREAFAIAKSGRPGPVLVDIPKDVQTALCEFEPKAAAEPFKRYTPSDRRIEAAVELVDMKSKPYIYIGGGVLSSGTAELVLELAEKIDAVIGCSLMGLTAIPTDHPRFLGMQGMHGHFASSVAQNKADLIIAVGARFNDRATGDPKRYARNASIIQLDADFAEIGKNVHCNVGVRGDMEVALKAIIAGVKKAEHPKWIGFVQRQRELEKEMEPKADGKLSPKAIMDAINATIAEDSVVATDVGQHQMWAAQYLKFRRERTLATSGGLGTMGFGMGAAIGACVATKKPTVLVTGDGSFGMNLNELATAVSCGLPLTVVLLNNGVLGMVRQWQTLFFNKHYSSTNLGRKTDFVKLAEAFGAKGVRAETPEQFEEEFAAAYASGGVTVIECPIDKDEFVLPMLPPGGSMDDMITQVEVDKQ